MSIVKCAKQGLVLSLLLLGTSNAFSAGLNIKPQVAQKIINQTALNGVRANYTESEPGFCTRFVREVLQKAFPKQSHMIDVLFDSTPQSTAANFNRYGLLRSYSAVAKKGGLKVGDVVFQMGGAGHTAIVVQTAKGLMIAENSWRYCENKKCNNVRDARYITSFKTFGRIDSVGRLTGF